MGLGFLDVFANASPLEAQCPVDPLRIGLQGKVVREQLDHSFPLFRCHWSGTMPLNCAIKFDEVLLVQLGFLAPVLYGAVVPQSESRILVSACHPKAALGIQQTAVRATAVVASFVANRA